MLLTSVHTIFNPLQRENVDLINMENMDITRTLKPMALEMDQVVDQVVAVQQTLARQLILEEEAGLLLSSYLTSQKITLICAKPAI